MGDLRRGFYQAGVRVLSHWPADYQNGDRQLYAAVVKRSTVDADPNYLLDFDDYGRNEHFVLPRLVKLWPKEQRSDAKMLRSAAKMPFCLPAPRVRAPRRARPLTPPLCVSLC